KMKNKNEASATFSNMKILDKAMNLAYFAHLDNTNLINEERKIYNDVDIATLQQTATQMFLENKYSKLYYLKNK
ncbi:MAG: insulinase family protein, partial [Bacteroidales bacterium]|nr:insulinase family protein [Bacteroidales bacterium]